METRTVCALHALSKIYQISQGSSRWRSRACEVHLCILNLVSNSSTSQRQARSRDATDSGACSSASVETAEETKENEKARDAHFAQLTGAQDLCSAVHAVCMSKSDA